MTRTLREVTLPDDVEPALAEPLGGAEIRGKPAAKRYVRKDGWVIWALATVTMTKNEAGVPAR
jgi:hypothetical protein